MTMQQIVQFVDEKLEMLSDDGFIGMGVGVRVGEGAGVGVGVI